MKKVLTIAGSDSSGGAGIQADLKTIAAHNMFGMSVITAITAQNTTGVYDIMDCSEKIVEKQIEAVFEDIRPEALKIGMVSSTKLINQIAESLKKYKPEHVVLDPVMISTSGCRLLDAGARNALITNLIPEAVIITPNTMEATDLCGISINDKSDMLKAAIAIYEMTGKNVLIKGGHLSDEAADLLFDGENVHWFAEKRVDNRNTHGTGCTLSSAIACNLAAGFSMEESVKRAKKYVYNAICYGLDLGKGDGPLWHNVTIN